MLEQFKGINHGFTQPIDMRVSEMLTGARGDLANLLKADPERTLLGSGATFWLNTVLLTQLNPGDRVPLTLTFKDGSSKEISAEVRSVKQMMNH